MSNQELADVCKKVSDLKINDIREDMSKNEFLKSFISTIINKMPSMKSSDLIEIIKELVKNPDLRDYRHTYYFWPNICKTISHRTESLSVEEVSDTLHSLCFLRINSPVFEELMKNLITRMLEFNSNDYSSLPINKIPNLLWALNFKKTDSSLIYQELCSGILKHKDFELISQEQIAMIANFFTQNKLVPKNLEIVRPIMNYLLEAIEENKLKYFHELVNVIYFMTQNKELPDRVHEKINKILILRVDEMTSSLILVRILKSNLKFSNELKQVLYKKIEVFLKNFTFIDLIDLYGSDVIISNNELKEQVLQRIKSKSFEFNKIKFTRLEKLINDINSGTDECARELYEVLERELITLYQNPNTNDSLLLRGMRWLMKSNKVSPIYSIFLTSIFSKNRLYYYHTRDMMNLILVISHYPSIQSESVYEKIDDKVFNFSHLFDGLEMAVVYYTLARMNRIYLETQELLSKRILEKDFNWLDVEGFSLFLISGVLNTNVEFCRRNLQIVKILMNFREIKHEYLKMGDLMKKIVNDFNISLITLIRCLYILAFLDIKDQRMFNSQIVAKIINFEPNNLQLTVMHSQDEKVIDRFHLLSLIQSLVILGIDYPECMAYVQKLAETVKPYIELNENEKDCQSTNLAKYARLLNLPYKTDEVLYGNRVLKIGEKVVFIYRKEHFKFQTDSYLNQMGLEHLRGYYFLRKKMMDALKIPYVEIEIGKWISMTEDNQIDFMKKQFSIQT